MWTDRQAVEQFHLQFLRALGARVDKSLFALKGGCNLRFFFRSVRYSEDMDLDVRTMSVATLRSNVDRLLETPAFNLGLRAHGLEIARTSAPMQTGTTQRWKIALRNSASGTEVPTRIEFSRRGLDGEKAVEAVAAEVIQRYRLYPVIVQHYTVHEAFTQKVQALALREQVQSRDVFDLKLLLDAGGADRALSANACDHLEAAIGNALAVDYDSFAGQVLAYLEPEYQDHYRSRKVWDTLQGEVIDRLEALAR